MLSIFRCIKIFLCLILFIILVPCRVLSAEILQISSASVFQIGDQNRNYKVRLDCINIDSSQEAAAVNWLRSELPRHSKINLLPKGYDEGILMAKIIKLKSNKDISKSMANLGFGELLCNE